MTPEEKTLLANGKCVPDDYFSTGVWRSDGPLAPRHHTCAECGERLSTWDSFVAHRSVCRLRERDSPNLNRT